VKNADKMVSLRPDLRSYSRVAYLRELYGDRTGAKAAMKMAADAGAFGQEDRAWCLKELANLYLGEGNLDTAEFIYKGIIEERPAYAFAYSGLAQIQIARKQFPDAIAILVKATQLSPEHIFIEQLADLYLTIGDTTSAVTMREKVFASFAQHEKDGWMVGKEYAAFCLGQSINPGEALMRAEKGYKTRPENIEALDVYSWALYKNGKAKEAAKYSEQAVRLGTDNAILYYHAAKIAQANADKIKAFSYFEKALARNPYMPVSMREDAIKSLSTLKKDS
jgi:tetratricopeptide (TPR) repeat protein